MTAAGPDPVALDLFDPSFVRCPYPAYELLRDSAPVWRDPATGAFVVTRYDDVRAILLDPGRFGSDVGGGTNRRERALAASSRNARVAARTSLLEELYAEQGIRPAANLSTRDDPEHAEVRRVLESSFRAANVAELEPLIEALAHRLIDAFIADGRCEWVSQFAAPLPLYVIGSHVGLPPGDLPRVKLWTQAWIDRMGLMQPAEELRRAVDLEVEARLYFEARFERLRAEPDGTLLSRLVNAEIPAWGRTLTDDELFAEVMSDLVVGGSETTTNALAAGVVLLAARPDVRARVEADPDAQLPAFVEEVLRLESPVQGLLRVAKVGVTLHGVEIPAGSVLNLRYAAANRDGRKFPCPASVDLDRPRARQHLAFGVGAHHCLGAALARAELHGGFKALLERVHALTLRDDVDALQYRPNFFVRSLRELHVTFERADVRA